MIDWSGCTLASCRGFKMTDSSVIFRVNNMPDLMEISRFTLSSLSTTACLLISVPPSGSLFTALRHSLCICHSVSCSQMSWRDVVAVCIHVVHCCWCSICSACVRDIKKKKPTCMSHVLSVPSLSAVTRYFPQGLTVITIEPRSLW